MVSDVGVDDIIWMYSSCQIRLTDCLKVKVKFCSAVLMLVQKHWDKVLPSLEQDYMLCVFTASVVGLALETLCASSVVSWEKIKHLFSSLKCFSSYSWLILQHNTTGWIYLSNSWHGVALNLSWRWQVSYEMLSSKQNNATWWHRQPRNQTQEELGRLSWGKFHFLLFTTLICVWEKIDTNSFVQNSLI